MKKHCFFKLYKSERTTYRQLFFSMQIAFVLLLCSLRAVADITSGIDTNSFQQEKITYTGSVTDNSQVPIIGATITLRDKFTGTATDLDGQFTIKACPGDIIVVSYIGYTTEQIKTGNNTHLNIVLTEDTKLLDEIIVVGYGTQKKENLTGAVAAVKGEEITKRPIANATLALQGLVSGVTVSSTTGQPGKEGDEIRIRGIGTLNNNNPLVLIDGLEGSLNGVNPNDIESITILKDAASSAIYGLRAGSGVILITTKRAKSGEFAVNFFSNLGFQEPANIPQFLGSLDYLKYYDIAAINDTRKADGSPGSPLFGEEYIENYRNNMALDPFTYPDTDWEALTYKSTAVQQQYGLSFTGGTDKLKAYGAFNTIDQEGILPDTELKRYTFRVNTDYQFSSKLSAGIDASARYSQVNEPHDAAATLGAVRRTAPIYSHINKEGQFAYVQLGSNTYARSRAKDVGYNNGLYTEGLVKLKLAYRPVENLRFDLSYSPKVNYENYKKDVKPIEYYEIDGTFKTLSPSLRVLEVIDRYYLDQHLTLLANFNQSFEEHNIALLGGFERRTNRFESLMASRQGSIFEYEVLSSFPEENQKGNGNASELSHLSYFGRVNYDYAGKYLLEANLRRDASSRFAKGYRWGIFPSFSAGWRISEEAFMGGTRNWLSNAKLRGSWGKLGNESALNNRYPAYMTIDLKDWTIINGTIHEGYIATQFAARDIRWETTEMIDIGLDLGFLNNKIELIFDYYDRKTSDILYGYDIPGVLGFSNKPILNIGQVGNKGWDLSLSYNDKRGDFSYRIATTLSDVKNEVIDLGEEATISNITILKEGLPMNALWGLEADGLFSSFEEAKNYPVKQFGTLQGGDIKYIDQLTIDTDGDGIPDAGDGIINEEDYVYMGNTIPRYTYSLDLSIQYKSFDLAIFFQGVGKRDSYITDDLAFAFNNGGKIQEWQRDGMWQEGETDSKYPRMFITSANNTAISTFWKQNGSYLRLKNIQLGYSVPKNLLKDFLVQEAKIYVSGHNLLTFHHMPNGYDPEQRPNNAQTTLPILRTYTFGVNLKF